MRSKSSTVRARLTVVLVLFVAVSLLWAGGVAQAVETRPGAKALQYDVMLTEYETKQVTAKNLHDALWAATVVCWNAGLGAKVGLWGYCQSQIATCAARTRMIDAKKGKKRAGITFSPGKAWCWSY